MPEADYKGALLDSRLCSMYTVLSSIGRDTEDGNKGKLFCILVSSSSSLRKADLGVFWIRLSIPTDSNDDDLFMSLGI